MEDITFETTNKIPLSGTLFLPNSPRAIAVLLPGSGPVDRNGNASQLPSQMYKHLATHLSSNLQIATLIYDKRGVSKSKTAASGIFENIGAFEHMDDAVRAWLYLLNRFPQFQEKSVLLGHSEGGINIPGVIERMNETDRPKAVVFLSSFGETLSTATAWQRQCLGEEVKNATGFQGWILRKLVDPAKIEEQIQNLENVLKTTDLRYRSRMFGLVKEPLQWYRDHFILYDQKPGLNLITGHVLGITGERDVQCRASQCNEQLGKTILPRAASITCYTPPNMNHLLRNQANPASFITMNIDYMKSCREPLADDFLEYLSSWLTKIFSF